jgi:hypothetical protein
MNSGLSDPRHPRRAGDLATLLYAFVGARTWNEARQLLEQHPELLDQEVDVLLDDLAAEATQHGDQSLLSEVERVRTLFQRCRAGGVDAAFADVMGRRIWTLIC